MVKSLVSKLSSASSISLASTLSSVGGGHGSGTQTSHFSQSWANYEKNRNDPGRFFGDGVQFKAKLIGILEVGEARGDRMCQEALQDLKMAIRAAGEHKQRITIHVTIDGLRLRDEKTGDSLYHHPVHKISFIAQDMTDSRAFGYIFGSPDSGHRFFGIKTDKAASQVVLAMRDLFQVVFELKKKEIELARQQIQSKSLHDHHLASLSSLKSSSGIHNDLNSNTTGTSVAGALSSLGGLSSGGSSISRLGVNLDIKGVNKEMSPESVADLVDLEQELSSIQRGITQMERITPNDPSQPHASSDNKDEDPFGDSFTNFPQAYNLLPPPESGRSRSKPISKTSDVLLSTTSSTSTRNVSTSQNIPMTTLLSPAPVGCGDTCATALHEEDDNWLSELDAQNDVFDTSKMSSTEVGLGSNLPLAPLAASETTSTPTQQLSENSAADDICTSGTATAIASQIDPEQSQATTRTDAFTDLDPLGTGRTRPYVDKKYFFQDLKNPPKKVLKDLSVSNSSITSATSTQTVNVASQLTSGQSNTTNTATNDLVGTQYNTVAAVVDEFLSKEGFFDGATTSLIDDTKRQQQKLKTHPTLSTTLTTNIGNKIKNMTTDATNTSLLTAASTGKSHNRTTSICKTTSTNVHLNRYDLESIVADTLIPADAIMLPRDTDPFSPTRKKSDPFQDGDIFSKLDPFEFEFSASGKAADSSLRISPTAAPTNVSRRPTTTTDVFNGPLQVCLPPERGVSPTSAAANTVGVHWKGDISRLERQSSLSPTITANNSIRSRPTPSIGNNTGAPSAHATSSSMFKQQTVDVISSISNKKMPHLFGQARFSKRGGDSNSINMRRLQESDSLSENETAPEPPPRPDSALHVEPPPLPPKKQFNDIVIRPHVTSGNAVSPPVSNVALSNVTTSVTSINRYEFLSIVPSSQCAADIPPIPLPSRRVGRSDGSYPGPGRPRKPGHTDDDYLAPVGTNLVTTGPISNTSGTDLPPLLPPPTQISTRARAQRQQSMTHKSQELYENKNEILQHDAMEDNTAILPDITLSQLLTLGIEELAVKLNVHTSKLSTMTLVELTSYLSEFIEKSKPITHNSSGVESVSPELANEATDNEGDAVFKVDFNSQSTFVAKFDDTFGEDLPRQSQESYSHGDTFVANFDKFNEPSVAPSTVSRADEGPAVPSADRYAVFREIIDMELQIQKENVDLIGMSDVLTPPSQNPKSVTKEVDPVDCQQNNGQIFSNLDQNFEDADDFLGPQSSLSQPPSIKIDTKITEVVAQAKDRYAALRDIILVENLFEKKPQSPPDVDDGQEYPELSDELVEDQDVKQIMKNRVSSGGDRLLDSRGLPAEPSSSAVTVEDDDDEEDEDGGGESSLDSNDKESTTTHGRQDHYEMLSTSTQQLDVDQSSMDKPKMMPMDAANNNNSNLSNNKQDIKFLTVANASGLSTSKDDLEIDELMQRAISNLSLDSRERISPAISMSAVTSGPRSTSETLATTQSPISASGLQQRSPVSLIAPTTNQRHQQKSPQISPVSAPLAVVSNLIDSATKQMSSNASIGSTGGSELLGETERLRMIGRKEAWATFDSPKTTYPNVNISEKRGTRTTNNAKAKSLHLPPAPPSITSQNDTAESPCSSDPRDDGWNKGRRCWPKAKDRQQTSSSSRDLSPWDDETTEYHKQQQRRIMTAPGHSHPTHPDRHEYYVRHARRMNSCDEDYDYDEELSNRRDHRKFGKGLSRSRDNFDLDSPSWFHHPAHHTWSPQDMEQAAATARMRGFDRSSYERTTYGPPIYDKRVGGGASSSYDRRAGFEKRKYYRDYGPRSNYEFEEYGETPSIQERYRDVGAFEKSIMGRRSDYENVYDEGRPSMSMMYGGNRARGEYSMYERDRKSFDRDSVESFESSTRRRRSFGSGEVYGSLESREEFRERYMMGNSGDKTRSLRKGMKLRATGDIDYEQDSENDFHQRPIRGGPGSSSAGPIESRSLQRPSQLVSGSGMSMSRIRKSSGSSPWDGEEVPLPGQKSAWKRPGSATDSERRLTENRRATAIGQTPSGSDNEKDRRFRKKSRTRGKDYLPGSGIGPIVTTTVGSGSNSRYGGNYDNIGPSSTGGIYPPANDDIDDDNDDDDYIDEDYDEPPTDEDKFERINRRRLEMNQRMLESDRRQHGISKGSKVATGTSFSVSSSKRYHHHCGVRGGNIPSYELEDYDEQTPTPRSTTSSVHQNSSGVGGSNNKFSFDGGGFESDFNQNSPPPAPAGTASSCTSTPAAVTSVGINKTSFRFSNDFSDREKLQQLTQNSTSVSSLQQFDLDATTSPASHATSSTTQKLRFDDNVKVSQFDDAGFEDDFSKAPFDFTKTDKDWKQTEPAQNAPALGGISNNSNNGTTTVATSVKKQHLRNNKMQQRQELIKKSESINIFVKKVEDPFEDDEFFTAPNDDTKPTPSTSSSMGSEHTNDKRTTGGNGFQWESHSNFAKFDENM